MRKLKHGDRINCTFHGEKLKNALLLKSDYPLNGDWHMILCHGLEEFDGGWKEPSKYGYKYGWGFSIGDLEQSGIKNLKIVSKPTKLNKRISFSEFEFIIDGDEYTVDEVKDISKTFSKALEAYNKKFNK